MKKIIKHFIDGVFGDDTVADLYHSCIGSG